MDQIVHASLSVFFITIHNLYFYNQWINKPWPFLILKHLNHSQSYIISSLRVPTPCNRGGCYTHKRIALSTGDVKKVMKS